MQESKETLYPCSTKTREVMGNPSPTAERFPETREISRGQSLREIARVEGNLEGGGEGFPITSRVLVEYGHSLSINFSTWSGSGNPSLEGLTVLKSILPCWCWKNVKGCCVIFSIVIATNKFCICRRVSDKESHQNRISCCGLFFLHQDRFRWENALETGCRYLGGNLQNICENSFTAVHWES